MLVHREWNPSVTGDKGTIMWKDFLCHDVTMTSSWVPRGPPTQLERQCVSFDNVSSVKNLNFSDLIRHSENTVLRISWERCVIWTTKGHCTKNDMSYFRKQHTQNHMWAFLHRSSPFTTIGTKCNVQSLKYDVHTFYCNFGVTSQLR